MAVETIRRAHWPVGPISLRGRSGFSLLAGAATNKSVLAAKPKEVITSISRFAFGALLILAWTSFLVWLAASAVLAVM